MEGDARRRRDQFLGGGGRLDGVQRLGFALPRLVGDTGLYLYEGGKEQVKRLRSRCDKVSGINGIINKYEI